MNLGQPRIGVPNLISIATFQATVGSGPATGPQILQEIMSRFEPTHLEPEDALTFTIGSSEAYAKVTREDEFQTLLVALKPREKIVAKDSFQRAQESCEADMRTLLQLLPENPVSLFTLRIGQVKSINEAKKLAQGYADRRLRSAGIMYECVASTLYDKTFDQSLGPLKREIIILPLSHDLDETSSNVWRLVGDLAFLASHAGRLSLLRSGRELMLKQVDASEDSTQLRIDEILMVLRRPTEQLKTEDLEEVLREVTVLFSRLSVLASSMRRDHVKANSILRQIKALFNAWNEQSLETYPTNSSMETDTYESIVSPFRDFTERVEALRVQLDMVLDAVRTYLGIQGQRLSIEEQRSSKEQLIRMVNLQEILHKFEILIVAFYLTEMGRLFFEALAPGTANLLTIVFIPAAFVIAISVMRFLHRPRNKQGKHWP